MVADLRAPVERSGCEHRGLTVTAIRPSERRNVSALKGGAESRKPLESIPRAILVIYSFRADQRAAEDESRGSSVPRIRRGGAAV
jgi:hypothetical protein